MLDLLRRQASDISPSDGKQLWGMQLCLFMKEFMIVEVDFYGAKEKGRAYRRY